MGNAAAAMGVLHVIRTHVGRTEYWREQYHASEAPAFMLLLEAIMARLPLLHGQARPEALTLPGMRLSK